MITTPIIGRIAKITRAIVQRTVIAIAAPQINIAARLNILPIFYPVAFWKARASTLKFEDSSN